MMEQDRVQQLFDQLSKTAEVLNLQICEAQQRRKSLGMFQPNNLRRKEPFTIADLLPAAENGLINKEDLSFNPQTREVNIPPTPQTSKPFFKTVSQVQDDSTIKTLSNSTKTNGTTMSTNLSTSASTTTNTITTTTISATKSKTLASLTTNGTTTSIITKPSSLTKTNTTTKKNTTTASNEKTIASSLTISNVITSTTTNETTAPATSASLTTTSTRQNKTKIKTNFGRRDRRDKQSATSDIQCQICNKKFIKNWQFKRHVTIAHTTSDQAKCPICSTVFSYRGSMSKHMKQVHSPKRFECPICRKMFSANNNLRKHVSLVHQSIRPFECSQCGKDFGQKAKLERYESINSFRHLTLIKFNSVHEANINLLRGHSNNT